MNNYTGLDMSEPAINELMQDLNYVTDISKSGFIAIRNCLLSGETEKAIDIAKALHNIDTRNDFLRNLNKENIKALVLKYPELAMLEAI